jgi:hypothetical protein
MVVATQGALPRRGLGPLGWSIRGWSGATGPIKRIKKLTENGLVKMTRDEIDLQQRDEMDLLVEVFDQALEAACGGLMQGSPTLAFGSYCFTCRPHLHRG